ncbi:MAG TPA: mycofactocin system glycosyltransferase [Actinobacteria bacterium]|nr:mycofactocin system glycosyltransferase [Actinomycetota bacterium]
MNKRAEAWDITLVVPAHDRLPALDRCLKSLCGLHVLVVDDASQAKVAVANTAGFNRAKLVRRPVNGGPAAARNDGIRCSSSEFVAFVDSDCTVPQGWLDSLLPHFDDPRVGAVAPRVRPRLDRPTVLARYEYERSALDMGESAQLVMPGSFLGYLPSATLVIRRTALPASGFNESMKVGEDVDLIWRIVDAGWQVRYEPRVQVEHQMRDRLPQWVKRRYEYGTSAAKLEQLHPGRLTPARVSFFSLVAAGGLITKSPSTSASALAFAGWERGRSLRHQSAPVALAPALLGRSLQSDFAAVGHLLRREWWPIGWITLAACVTTRGPVSRAARAASVAMIAPIASEWWRTKPGVNLVQYTALRLLEDAAYGTGVIAGSMRNRVISTLVPQIHLPQELSRIMSMRRIKRIADRKRSLN